MPTTNQNPVFAKVDNLQEGGKRMPAYINLALVRAVNIIEDDETCIVTFSESHHVKLEGAPAVRFLAALESMALVLRPDA